MYDSIDLIVSALRQRRYVIILAHRYRMRMLNQQLNSPPMFRRTIDQCNLARLLLVNLADPHALLVKFDKQERLVLDRREQIMIPDQVEYIRLAKAEEVGERFGGLAVQDVAV